jgi:glycosyltransferase involved in cell wall biosynthesis
MNTTPLQVILVANYRPDGQESMLRFAAALERELQSRGCGVAVVAPRPILGALRQTRHGLGKWLGYVDKFVLFPWALRAAVRRARRDGRRVVVHVCDHSNAIYTRHLQDVPHVVTCNDLLAVRSARGEFPENPTRWSGRILQRLILAGLNRAQQVACISDATRADVVRLAALADEAVHRVYMGLNHPYRRVAGDAAWPHVARLCDAGVRERGFVLHVGGNQWYKNRLGVLRIYLELTKRRCSAARPALVMVGPPFSAAMRDFVRAHGLQRDVVELAGVDNADLEALYSTASALLFPSLAEGFGWPVLEALACECPVVTSNRAPLTEVAADAAVYIEPDAPADAAAVVDAVLIEPADQRRLRAARGLRRAAAFSGSAMADAYLGVYHRVLAEAC